MAAGFGAPIDAKTRYCAVFGHPIAHSASPAMHNAALAVLGLNWRYLAFDVRPEALAQALDGAKKMHLLGLNLTVPHKVLAVSLMDLVDPSAQEWGAVNTVRFEGLDGDWRPLGEFGAEPPKEVRAHGFNTDAEAILKSLEEDLGFQPAGSRVLVLGAGGAGRVAALKLAASGVAELCLLNRTRSKAEAVERTVHQRFPGVRTRLDYPSGPVDLVLNATSVGLKVGDDLPLDRSFSLSRAKAVYDMIYRPAQTLLLQAAAVAGCRQANGLGMLLYQGAAALELWCGQAAPVQEMKQAVEAHIYGRNV